MIPFIIANTFNSSQGNINTGRTFMGLSDENKL